MLPLTFLAYAAQLASAHASFDGAPDAKWDSDDGDLDSHRDFDFGDPWGPGRGDWGSAKSVCDRYTTSILGANTAATQALFVTIFVNTGMVGNYTTPNAGVYVPGVIWPSVFRGRPINQMPYFTGELASSNLDDGDLGHGVAINWLDGGGPAALRQNLSAFDQDSNQWRYFTHLHEYFAYLLGCSLYGNVVDRYGGNTNMYHVHKYMTISDLEEQYTNAQFVLAGASLGFADADQAFVRRVLEWLFSRRCSPPKPVPHWAKPAPQAICSEELSCPLSPKPVCQLYKPLCDYSKKSNNKSPRGRGRGWPGGDGDKKQQQQECVEEPRFVTTGEIYDE
ncbi:hypothetical protein F4778DRAFT_783957 [Xylariomycetidae sp. FL2044]|nr:hypothetical protein F4778DRAFT_783957 [Xylariomycetidae sp. FL2044]